MNYSNLFNWVGRKLNIKKRLRETAILYVFSLMISMRKHSIEAVASFSGKSNYRFSKFLKNRTDLAVIKLDELSKNRQNNLEKIFDLWLTESFPGKFAS